MPRIAANLTRVFAAITLAITGTSCEAGQTSSSSASSAGRVEVGQPFQICKNCPIFIRVPSAPAPLRKIEFVSKYELTWNNFIDAVEDGSCKMPALAATGADESLDLLKANVRYLRIDWPATQLGPSEIECYMRWLQTRTKLRVALPTGAEWEWFASGGKKELRYPWGNSPAGGGEVLYDRSSGRLDRRFQDPVPDDNGGYFVSAMKVGQSTANAWGLYDLMGNAIELTSEIIPYAEWKRSHPGEIDLGPYDWVKAKGVESFSAQDWSETSIKKDVFIGSRNGHYSAPAVARLILIAEGQ